jgi:hypothetical protein
MAMVSITFTTNFFLLVVAPLEFDSSIAIKLILQISFAMVVSWSILYEIYERFIYSKMPSTRFTRRINK